MKTTINFIAAKKAVLGLYLAIFTVSLTVSSCGKNKDYEVQVLSSDVPNLQQTFTITQDGKSHTFNEAVNENIVLHKGKVQFTLTTSTGQVVMTPARVKLFVKGQSVQEIVCEPNNTVSGEFKLKP